MLNIKNLQVKSMTHVGELDACESCRNVFAKMVGTTNILVSL